MRRAIRHRRFGGRGPIGQRINLVGTANTGYHFIFRHAVDHDEDSCRDRTTRGVFSDAKREELALDEQFTIPLAVNCLLLLVGVLKNIDDNFIMSLVLRAVRNAFRGISSGQTFPVC